MMCSASGTYSFPSAFMKSCWVSTSQMMTRGMPASTRRESPGNLSEDMGRCQQRMKDGLQPEHDGNLVTAILPRAPRAIRPDLERKVFLLGRDEPEPEEERGLAREGEHLREALRAGLPDQGRGQGAADAGTLIVRMHGEPRDLTQVARIDLQRRTAGYAA